MLKMVSLLNLVHWLLLTLSFCSDRNLGPKSKILGVWQNEVPLIFLYLLERDEKVNTSDDQVEERRFGDTQISTPCFSE